MQATRNNNVNGRQQMPMKPHSIDAEEATLGSMLVDPSVISIVREMINPDDFYMIKNRWLYEILIDMHERGDAIDFLTVTNEIERLGKSGDIDMAYHSHLINTVPTAIHAPAYAQIVADTSACRTILDIAGDMAKGAYGDGANSIDDVIDKGVMHLMAVKARVSPKDEPEKQLSVIPDLPKEAKLDYNPAWNVGRFITRYADYGMAASPMTPRLFHESAALWLASVVIARRLKLCMDFATIYPNLYILWLAASTLWHKTTAMNILSRLAWKACPHLLAAQDSTFEAMLSDMAGKEPSSKPMLSENDARIWSDGRNYPAQKGLIRDEISGLLAGAGKDYNAGILEALLDFYESRDYPPYTRSTKSEGHIVIKNPYMCLLGASTPAAMSKHMTVETLWSNGWWPRFALLTPETERPDYLESKDPGSLDRLVSVLDRLYNMLPNEHIYPDPPRAKSVVIEQDALAAWKKYQKAVGYDLVTDSLNSRLWPVYGRLPIHGLKTAMILAALDWSEGCFKNPDVWYANRSAVYYKWVRDIPQVPTITLQHMARALYITEQWRASAHRALVAVTTSEAGRFLQQVLSYVGRYGQKGATLRDLYRALHKQPQEVESALRQLMATGEVIEGEYRSRGGRPAKRYKLA